MFFNCSPSRLFASRFRRTYTTSSNCFCGAATWKIKRVLRWDGCGWLCFICGGGMKTREISRNEMKRTPGETPSAVMMSLSALWQQRSLRGERRAEETTTSGTSSENHLLLHNSQPGTHFAGRRLMKCILISPAKMCVWNMCAISCLLVMCAGVQMLQLSSLTRLTHRL